VSSWVLALVVFAVILGGSFGGMLLRLPANQLAEDSKDLVRLGTGVIGTISALVLGLLIASAKTSYDTQRSQVRELTANIILLDRVLAEYGPEANAARDALRRSITPLVDQIWREGSSGATATTPFEPTATIEEALHEVQELSPQNDNQRALQARAIQVFADLAHTRLLLFAQTDNPIPKPFLVVLVFWLTIIFASFSLFTRPNTTVVAALFIFALSTSGAIFLILELGQPFSGLMRISSAPLRNALAPLGP